MLVPITFKAGNIRAGKYSAVLEVLGNDPKNPSIEVPVSLTIREKRSLIANPTRVDFSDVEVGVSGKKTFVLKNTGNNVVRLSNAMSRL